MDFGFIRFSKPAEAYSVEVEDDEDSEGTDDDAGTEAHGPWNNYCCGNPNCICCNVDQPETLAFPPPWRALQ